MNTPMGIDNWRKTRTGERPVRRLWLEQTAAENECGSGGSNMEKIESMGLETE